MSIKAISPLDGRYQHMLLALSEYFSEWALMKYRVHVEVEWLIQLAESEWIPEVRSFRPDEVAFLRNITTNFDETEAHQIKKFEQTTRHDVKAVEYYVKSKLAHSPLEAWKEFVHFACTSEDINNLSHGLMLKQAIAQVWLPLARKMVAQVAAMAQQAASIAMLAHTHGQPATPTTLGKELAVFVHRWQRQLKQVENLEYLGKLNGAVGNYNAHVFAYPDVPWQEIARNFVERLGLTFNPLTTQIESHDYMAEIFQAIIRFNTITLDFDRDMWSYISLGYFKQRTVEGEVGSSTMPHKVNPIHFENAEANFIISSALFDCLANKLPVSRLQRDLSDSSALRNMGVGFGHSYLALLSTIKGMEGVSVNEQVIQDALANSWEVLGEAVQTLMRKYGHENPYEKLKALTRGHEVVAEEMKRFVRDLQVSPEDKKRLLEMEPQSYIGLAPQLVEHIFEDDRLS
ncbi:MAG TPA: adenylosuccinate lyase [Ktedonosporobacter sp.]|jgi:adenylosuccinate lyase|nr:adenylosuccinate lyase [Ktedonosporobacter sp.]